jgi:hypothetical protein
MQMPKPNPKHISVSLCAMSYCPVSSQLHQPPSRTPLDHFNFHYTVLQNGIKQDLFAIGGLKRVTASFFAAPPPPLHHPLGSTFFPIVSGVNNFWHASTDDGLWTFPLCGGSPRLHL